MSVEYLCAKSCTELKPCLHWALTSTSKSNIVPMALGIWPILCVSDNVNLGTIDKMIFWRRHIVYTSLSTAFPWEIYSWWAGHTFTNFSLNLFRWHQSYRCPWIPGPCPLPNIWSCVFMATFTPDAQAQTSVAIPYIMTITSISDVNK